jgi:hypothetical protein
MENNYYDVGIFSPSGEPILPHLLRYSPIAVEDHVIASEAWRSHVHAHRHEIAAVASLLATESPTNSTLE